MCVCVYICIYIYTKIHNYSENKLFKHLVLTRSANLYIMKILNKYIIYILHC
jgi:hypothetical protein